MKKEIYQVDAFTHKTYSGNAAGVVPDAEGLSSLQMQLIANEMNLAETAFVFPGSIDYDFELRFFTPTEEVDLCGHATIATFSLLKELGVIPLHKKRIIQKTKAGKLNIQFLEDGSILMQQASPINLKKEIPLDELFTIMGLASEDVGIENLMEFPEIWSTGLPDLLLPIKSIETLKNLTPAMDKLANLSQKLNIVGVHAFSINTENQVWCRNFAPAFGIPEESATGTSNGALGACLYTKRWGSGKDLSFVVHQGDWMERPSRIIVQVDTENDFQIWVGGKAVTVFEGKLIIPE